MEVKALSTCFCTHDVAACKTFYQTLFNAKVSFDCGWYVTLQLQPHGLELSFIEPQGDMPLFQGQGVTVNFKVDDVDAEFTRLNEAAVEIGMPLEDHPWGDRGFSILDPIGNSVYIYSDREPSEEFAGYYVD